MTETKWGPWIDWHGGECPIPWAKAGDFQIRLRSGLESGPDWKEAELWCWVRREGGFSGDITAYRVRADLMHRVAPAGVRTYVDGDTTGFTYEAHGYYVNVEISPHGRAGGFARVHGREAVLVSHTPDGPATDPVVEAMAEALGTEVTVRLTREQADVVTRLLRDRRLHLRDAIKECRSDGDGRGELSLLAKLAPVEAALAAYEAQKEGLRA